MIKEFSLLLLVCLFLSACTSSTITRESNQVQNVELEESNQKRDVESIPIVAVDDETNGKRFGETHLYLNAGDLFLQYEFYDSSEIANSKFLEKKSNAKQVLKTETLFSSGEKKVGEKALVVFNSKDKGMRFCLLWVKDNKLTEVKAESLEAINEFEQTYKI